MAVFWHSAAALAGLTGNWEICPSLTRWIGESLCYRMGALSVARSHAWHWHRSTDQKSLNWNLKAQAGRRPGRPSTMTAEKDMIWIKL
jgi:hypothetical protein